MSLIEKPPSPHGLIGDHWPEIDELGIAKVATALANAGTGAGTAEQKSYQDGRTYLSLLPEGFETQVDAAFKVGGMAADLSGWFTKCATEAGVVAEGVALGKLLIAVTTMVAEAVIASKEAEIAALQLVSLRPEVRAQRIQQLRAEIKQITDDAKQAIQELYDGIYTPTAPAAPGLQPLVNNAPFGQKFDYGSIVPAGTGTGTVPELRMAMGLLLSTISLVTEAYRGRARARRQIGPHREIPSLEMVPLSSQTVLRVIGTSLVMPPLVLVTMLAASRRSLIGTFRAPCRNLALVDHR